MRFLTFAAFYGVVALGSAGAAWAVAPASGTVVLRATATFSDGSTSDRVFEVRSDADSDGDGAADTSWLRVVCTGGAATAAYHTVKSPRDAASGMASGKRQHGSVKIVKEWDAREAGSTIGTKASWDLATMKGGKAGSPKTSTYDVKKVEGTGARTTGAGQAASTGSGQAHADHGGASDASAGKGAHGKTMAHDDWHEVVLTEGGAGLCA